MNDQSLHDVCPPAQVDSSHPAAVIQMRVPALEFFGALAQQSLASLTTNASAIGIHGLLFPSLTTPALGSALRLRAIGPNSRLCQITQDLFAVVTLSVTISRGPSGFTRSPASSLLVSAAVSAIR